MGFFIGMFICNLLMPLVMVIGGYFMYKNPPKEINGVMGYRTKMSRKNKDTWAFAHDYCGRLWLKIGVVITIVTIAVQFPFINAEEEKIGLLTAIIEITQMVILLGSIIPVEIALNRTFDKDGKRRAS